MTRRARAATPGNVVELRRALSEQAETVRAGDFVAFFALDEAMHRRLMEIAGHPFVWPVIAGAKAQLDRVRFLSLEDPAWLDMILDQHGSIVDRIAAADADGASVIMQRHLRTAFAAIDCLAAEHADFFEDTSTPASAERALSSRRARR